MANIDFSKLYPSTHKKICNDLIITILSGVNVESEIYKNKTLFRDFYKILGEENFINLINTQAFFIDSLVDRVKSSISITFNTDKLKCLIDDESNRQKIIIDCVKQQASIRQLKSWFGLHTHDISFIRKMYHIKEPRGRVDFRSFEHLANKVWQFFESVKNTNDPARTYLKTAQEFNLTIKEVGAILDNI